MVQAVTYLFIIAKADAVWKQLENEIIFIFIYFLLFGKFFSFDVQWGTKNKREKFFFKYFIINVFTRK